MLISVAIDIADLEAIPVGNIAILFSELLRSSRRGYHRVVIPRTLSRWIGENISLSEIDLAHLVRLRAEYTQLAGQVSDATVLSQVVVGDDLMLDGGGKIIKIGHERLLACHFLDRTVLLLENAINDGRMFEEILFHEAKRRSFGEISFCVANGGGSGTAAELKRFVEDGTFVICVCDTDLVVPGGKRSATCSAVLTQANRIFVPGIVSVTPGREAENFLPIDVLDLIYSKDKSVECAALRRIFLNQGESRSGDCIWLYLDLKSGLPIGKLLMECNTPEKKAWAATKFNVSEERLDEIVFSGLGEDVITRYFGNDAARAAFHKFSRSAYWSKHFGAWIENLLWGMCGRKELRTG